MVLSEKKKEALIIWFNCLSEDNLTNITDLARTGDELYKIVTSIRENPASFNSADINKADKFLYIQKFIDAVFDIESRLFVDYDNLNDEFECAKITLFVLTALLQHLLFNKNIKINSLNHLDTSIQVAIKDMASWILSEKKITGNDFDILVCSPSITRGRSRINRNVSTPQYQGSLRSTSSSKSTPSNSEVIETPLKTYLNSPQVQNKSTIYLNKELNYKIHTLENRLYDLQRENDSLKKDLAKKGEEIQDLKERRSKLQQAHDEDMIKQSDNYAEQCEKLKQEIKNLKEIEDSYKILKNEYDKLLDEKKETPENTQENPKQIVESNKNLQSELNAALEEKNKICNLFELEKKKRSSLETTVKDLQDEVKMLNVKYYEVTNELLHIQQKNISCTSNSETVKDIEETFLLRSLAQDLKKDLRCIQAQLKAKEIECSALKNNIATLSNINSTCTTFNKNAMLTPSDSNENIVKYRIQNQMSNSPSYSGLDQGQNQLFNNRSSQKGGIQTKKMTKRFPKKFEDSSPPSFKQDIKENENCNVCNQSFNEHTNRYNSCPVKVRLNASPAPESTSSPHSSVIHLLYKKYPNLYLNSPYGTCERAKTSLPGSGLVTSQEQLIYIDNHSPENLSSINEKISRSGDIMIENLNESAKSYNQPPIDELKLEISPSDNSRSFNVPDEKMLQMQNQHIKVEIQEDINEDQEMIIIDTNDINDNQDVTSNHINETDSNKEAKLIFNLKKANKHLYEQNEKLKAECDRKSTSLTLCKLQITEIGKKFKGYKDIKENKIECLVKERDELKLNYNKCKLQIEKLKAELQKKSKQLAEGEKFCQRLVNKQFVKSSSNSDDVTSEDETVDVNSDKRCYNLLSKNKKEVLEKALFDNISRQPQGYESNLLPNYENRDEINERSAIINPKLLMNNNLPLSTWTSKNGREVTRPYVVIENNEDLNRVPTHQLKQNIVVNGFLQESEEPDFFNHSSISEINRGPVTQPQSASKRVSELGRRNSLYPPHLKSIYPVEMQCLPIDKYPDDSLHSNLKGSNDLARPSTSTFAYKRESSYSNEDLSPKKMKSTESQYNPTGCKFFSKSESARLKNIKHSKGNKDNSNEKNKPQ